MTDQLLEFLNHIAASLFFQTAIATGFGALMGSWTAFRFEQSARRRRDYQAAVVAGNQALTTLRRYYFLILKYGHSTDILFGDIGGDVEPTHLQQGQLGFLFEFGFPAVATNLFDAEDLSLSVLAKIRRFAEIRPAGGAVNLDSAPEFNALQPMIYRGIGVALPALNTSIRSLHSILTKKLPPKYAAQIIGISDIGPEAEGRRARQMQDEPPSMREVSGRSDK